MSEAPDLQPGNGYRVPPQAYFDADWHAREARQLFPRVWNFVGMTEDFSEVGDYAAISVGDQPLIVVRGSDGSLRAFHNVCRHRGVRMLDGRGNRNNITCPYHRWQYNLDGTLRNIPQGPDLIPTIDLADWPLLPVQIDEWMGLVFVNPDGTAPPLMDWLGDLADVLAPYQADQLEELAAGTYQFEANWKFYIENHVDWYHLWYTHPVTLKEWDHHAGVRFQWGRNWGSFEPRREDVDPPAGFGSIAGLSPPLEQNGAHFIFPNLTLFTGDGYFATGLVEPAGPERSTMQFRARVAPGQNLPAAVATGMLKQFQEVTEVEDAGITERLQSAVRSPAFAVGPMMGEFEVAITAFHDHYLAYVVDHQLNE